ncbi:MAG TPA: hypothetical protein VFV52_07630 [Bacilli bacterium]|nr:hypothetical protein [Bacilli bacterium]
MTMSNETERLASLETKLSSLEEMLRRMDEKIDNLQNRHITLEEVNEMMRLRDAQVQQLREDIRESNRRLEEVQLESKRLYPQWAAVLIALASLGITLIKF